MTAVVTLATVRYTLVKNGGKVQVLTGGARGEPGADGAGISILDFIPVAEHAAIYAGTSTYDCSTALSNAIASVTIGAGSFYYGGPRIYFPPGKYYFASTIQLKRTVILEGDAGVQGAGGAFYSTSELNFAAGLAGIIVHRYNTFGSGTAANTQGGDGSIIRNLKISSTRGQAYNQQKPGIWLRARAAVVDCLIDGFPGDGIMVRAAAGGGGDLEGNANNWCVSRVRCAQNSGSGLYVNGADANAGIAELVDASSNGAWGIWDNSFLGNTYVACHSDNNGVNGVGANGTSTSIVIDGGKTWYVVKGQAAAASTTQPGTNAAVWGKVSDVAISRPAWVSGGTYIDGGAYRSDGLNAPVSLVGCYSESGQAPAQLSALSLANGGIHAAGLVGAILGARNLMVAGGPALEMSRAGSSSDSFSVQLGARTSAEYTVLTVTDTLRASSAWRMKMDTDGSLYWDYAGAATSISHAFIGPGTTRTFGRSVAQPYAFQAIKFVLGSGNNARQHDTMTAAPTTGEWARGDIVYNRDPSAGGKLGWVCTAGGTPGTWKAFGAIDA